jgi:hypothetical protein
MSIPGSGRTALVAAVVVAVLLVACGGLRAAARTAEEAAADWRVAGVGRWAVVAPAGRALFVAGGPRDASGRVSVLDRASGRWCARAFAARPVVRLVPLLVPGLEPTSPSDSSAGAAQSTRAVSNASLADDVVVVAVHADGSVTAMQASAWTDGLPLALRVLWASAAAAVRPPPRMSLLSAVPVAAADGSLDVAVSAGASVVALRASDGRLRWAARAPGDGGGRFTVAASPDGRALYTLSQPAGAAQAAIERRSPADGSVAEAVVPTGAPADARCVLAGDASGVLCSDGSSSAVSCLLRGAAAPPECRSLTLPWPGHVGAWNARALAFTVMDHATRTAALVLTDTLHGTRVVAVPAAATPDDGPAVAYLRVPGGPIVAVQGGCVGEIGALRKCAPLHGSLVASGVASVHALPPLDPSEPMPDLLIESLDAQVHLLPRALPSAPAWSRDESRAFVERAVFVALPAAERVVEQLEAEFDVHASFATHLVRRFQPSALAPLVRGLLGDRAAAAAAAPSSSTTRDTFGFTQMIVAVTSVGRLLGLSSVDGSIVWARTLNGRELLQVVQLRHEHSGHPWVALVSLERGRGVHIETFDALTGAAVPGVEPLVIPGADRLEHLTSLPADRAAGESVSPLVYVVSPGKGGVYPADALARAANTAAAIAPAAAIGWAYDEAAHSLYGFTLLSNGELHTVWSRPVGGSGQSVSFFALNAPSYHIRAPVSVEDATDGLATKYVNPNLVAVMVERPESETAPATLSMALVDGANGREVYSAAHDHAAGPLHVVLCDNWVVYHYVDLRLRRYVLTTVELYLPGASASSAVVHGLAALNASQPLNVRYQTQLLNYGVDAIGVTRTRHGVTRKQLVFALSSGVLATLDKTLLDTRRAEAGDAFAAQLVPFQSELRFDAPQMLTRGAYLPSARCLVSAPTLLESTSLVLAVGDDLHLSRLAPSKSFDRMPNSDNFSVQLAISLAALAVGVYLLRMLVRRDAVQRQWLAKPAK